MESCWQQDPSARPTFDQIVKIMTGDDTLVIRGTDIKRYKEYQARMTKEESTYQLKGGSIGIRRGTGLRIADLAEKGDPLAMEQYSRSVNKLGCAGHRPDFQKYRFMRSNNAFENAVSNIE